MNRWNLLVISTVFLSASLGMAKVQLSNTVQVDMNASRVKANTWTAKDMNKIVPVELKDTKQSDDAGYVFNRVGDKAIQYWLATPEVQGSSVGRTATTVDKAMRTEMNVKTGGGSRNKVDHKISFQVLALQSSAKLEYKGWTNAAVDYDARDRASKVQVSERVWKNKDLTLSHTANQREDVSAVGVRWNW